ncbi:hypothetical protein JMF89_00150 [Clostridiaceae bacterium UIB06]|uniref:Uncharacterized protein n=1 Tax=Clostridium thailandense TaxID=2794346 RepID=A0A949U3G4_9CLOT|nr:hypothetical protein [Clostridium thailandense]MBV7276706.1 hypothetical protein [Clostridium thailandense]MCH5135630.1 hypothetical protein [Clostridiaceae bacterium UIB06]
MKKKKCKAIHKNYDIESDEYFYYIAGYTSNGVPFGITWEEAIRDGLVEEKELIEELSDDLPF